MDILKLLRKQYGADNNNTVVGKNNILFTDLSLLILPSISSFMASNCSWLCSALRPCCRFSSNIFWSYSARTRLTCSRITDWPYVLSENIVRGRSIKMAVFSHFPIYLGRKTGNIKITPSFKQYKNVLELFERFKFCLFLFRSVCLFILCI